MRPLLLAVFALWCSGCAHTRDDEMSAPEHRNEAAIHAARAGQQRGQFDPGERRAIARPHGDPTQEWNARVYNPSREHLDAADREMRSAAEHLAAARRLEAFENARCAEVPRAERAACPLLASSVTRVSETQFGIMLELKPEVDAVATQLRLDCHLAYATAQGFDRPSCPLFVKGMTIALVFGDGRHFIAMSSDDPKAAEQIREQARRIFLMPPAVSQRE